MSESEVQRKLREAHEKADAALAVAYGKVTQLREELTEAQEELENRRYWLRGVDGSDPKAAKQLSDSVEFQQMDPVQLFQEIMNLVRKETELRSAVAAAALEHEKVKTVERLAFGELHHDLFRQARVASLKLYVELARALEREKQEANAIQGRPDFRSNNVAAAHSMSGFLNLRDQSGGLMYLLKAAHESGFISGDEPWLEGLPFRKAGHIGPDTPLVHNLGRPMPQARPGAPM